MREPTDAFDAGLGIARALEAQGVSYALGGALAYGQFGIPRATNDVDVNVFVEPDALTPVLAALRGVGISVDDVAARSAATSDGLFIVWLGPYRIDVFTPSIPFSWEAEGTRIRRSIEGQDVWFLAPEALCVFKLLFFRSKDVADLERLVAVQGRALDVAYVRTRLADMVGERDERVAAWDRIVRDHLPA